MGLPQSVTMKGNWRMTAAIAALSLATFSLFWAYTHKKREADDLADSLYRLCEAIPPAVPGLHVASPNPYNPSAQSHPWFRFQSATRSACDDRHSEALYDAQQRYLRRSSRSQ